MAKIGLIDVDGHNFPNLALMKLSAWHKKQGDHVEWYSPLFSGHMDRVYMSKVFSFTPDYEYHVDADVIVRGGTGYAIRTDNGMERFAPEMAEDLPDEIEHIFPDYTIYPELAKDTAYGFLFRGCPRHCSFCHVGDKEGLTSRKVADVREFWNGQEHIQIMDPNITACADRIDLLEQLAATKAFVDINQGMDARLLTEEIVELLRKIRIKRVHFAWDRYKDGEVILKNLRMLREITRWERKKIMVYVLVNFDTTLEQDMERVQRLKELNVCPFVMVYNKNQLSPSHTIIKFQRYVNNQFVFWSKDCKSFQEYSRIKGYL